MNFSWLSTMSILKKYDRLTQHVEKQSCHSLKFSLHTESSVFITIFLKFQNVNTFSSGSVDMIIQQNVNTVRCMNIQLTNNSCANRYVCLWLLRIICNYRRRIQITFVSRGRKIFSMTKLYHRAIYVVFTYLCRVPL